MDVHAGLAPPMGDEKTGSADPSTGPAKLADAQRKLRRAAGGLLVALPPVRDLLLRVKHLFVAAKTDILHRSHRHHGLDDHDMPIAQD
jgi:hypothetical protein